MDRARIAARAARFLLVPPGYDGPLPDSGYHVGHSRTTRAFLLGRAFMVNDDPAPTVELIKAHDEDLPLCPGWFRHEHRHAAGRPGRLLVSSPQ